MVTHEWEEDGGTGIISPPVRNVRACDPCRASKTSETQGSRRRDWLEEDLYAGCLAQGLLDPFFVSVVMKGHVVGSASEYG
jgi:hypothetical protein